MYKKPGIVVLAVVFAAVLSSGFAQEAAQRDAFLAVGARALYASADNALNNSMGPETSVDDEFGYGAMVKFAVSQRLWVQFAVDAFTFTGDLVEPGLVISSDIETIPVTGTLLYNLAPRNSAIRPYLGAGIGYYLNDFDKVTASAFGFVADLKEYAAFGADDGFGWHVCAGVDWFLTNNLAINLEAIYRWVEYDWDVIMTPFGLGELGEDISGSGSDDLDGWGALVGLSFFF
jgi:outer membrane protein